jgi:HEAT repeat protein
VELTVEPNRDSRITATLQSLERGDAGERLRAIEQLGAVLSRRVPVSIAAFGEFLRGPVVSLVKHALKHDRDEAVRAAAAILLARFARETSVEIAVESDLIAVRDDTSERVRTAVAMALAGVSGAAHRRIVPVLVHMLNDPSARVRAAVARACGTFSCGDETEDLLLQGLQRALRDPERDVARAAAAALVSRDPSFEWGAVEAGYAYFLEHGDIAEREEALWWISEHDDPSLTNECGQVRCRIVSVLGAAGSAAQAALPALCLLLESSECSDDLRDAVEQAIAQITGTASTTGSEPPE